jgi:hypothetical protein
MPNVYLSLIYTQFIYSLHNLHLGNCLKINSLSRLIFGE